MKLADVSRAQRGWSWFDHDADKAVTAAEFNAEATKNIPVQAALTAQNAKTVAEGDELTKAARGTVAQRRLEKLDMPLEKESQLDAITGRKKAKHLGTNEPKMSGFAAEDEQAMADRIMRMSGEGAQ
jgi:hypothetical protein